MTSIHPRLQTVKIDENEYSHIEKSIFIVIQLYLYIRVKIFVFYYIILMWYEQNMINYELKT